MDLYDLENLVRVPTCYKNPENPSCIFLFLTSKNLCFQDTNAFEAGLPDSHKLAVTVTKAYFRKMKPKTIRYKSYKNFDNYAFRSTLLNYFMCENSKWKLEDLVNSTLNYISQRIPLKSRYVRAYQFPYMSKTISQAIMVRNRLKNKCMKNLTEKNERNCTRQRNLCVKLLRKEKKNFFASLDTKNIADNKTFWQTGKSFFSDKTFDSDQFILINNHEIISDDENIAKTLNDFFSNVVQRYQPSRIFRDCPKIKHHVPKPRNTIICPNLKHFLALSKKTLNSYFFIYQTCLSTN